MPVVTVEWWEGRTIEQKKQAAQSITAALKDLGVPPEATQVIFKDVPKHNWAIAGKLASEQ